jgi:hypothetical protein
MCIGYFPIRNQYLIGIPILQYVIIGTKAQAGQEPTVAETETAIRKLKNNKAPGMDLIQA